MIKSKHKFILAFCLSTGALLSANTPLYAQTFSYTNCDAVAGFRLSGGPFDLVVNLGPVDAFEKLPPRSVITITNLSTAQLADALPTLNGVEWSVSGAMRGNVNYSQYALQTIWITSPRPDVETPGRVWKCQSHWTLGGAASQIDAIGLGAATYANSQPAGNDNSSTGVAIPSGNQYGYTFLMGGFGDLSGTFQGDSENLTPDNFETSGQSSRSVFYKLSPSADGSTDVPGVVVGFFDFKPDGTLVFTAGPPPEQTIISKISQLNSSVTIWFSTVNLVGYRLRYTDSEGLHTPVSSWNIGDSVVGDGTTLSIQTSNSTSTRFYAVEAYY